MYQLNHVTEFCTNQVLTHQDIRVVQAIKAILLHAGTHQKLIIRKTDLTVAEDEITDFKLAADLILCLMTNLGYTEVPDNMPGGEEFKEFMQAWHAFSAAFYGG